MIYKYNTTNATTVYGLNNPTGRKSWSAMHDSDGNKTLALLVSNFVNASKPVITTSNLQDNWIHFFLFM